MEQAKVDYLLWIDWKNKIISFKSAAGFEEKVFPSPEEKLNYALTRCAAGFRIQ